MLRNKSTGDTYLVILFTLYLREDVNDDGSLKPAALAAHQPETAEAGAVSSTTAAVEPEDPAALEEAKKKLETGDRGASDEDVD